MNYEEQMRRNLEQAAVQQQQIRVNGTSETQDMEECPLKGDIDAAFGSRGMKRMKRKGIGKVRSGLKADGQKIKSSALMTGRSRLKKT